MMKIMANIPALSTERLPEFNNSIKQVFNNDSVDQVQLLQGGFSSSKTYKITIKDKAYVIRVMGLDQTLSD